MRSFIRTPSGLPERSRPVETGRDWAARAQRRYLKLADGEKSPLLLLFSDDPLVLAEGGISDESFSSDIFLMILGYRRSEENSR